MKRKNHRYLGTCETLPAEFLATILSNSRAISYQYFVRMVPIPELEKAFPDFNWGSNGHGKRMKHTVMIRYLRSRLGKDPFLVVIYQQTRYVFALQ